jgi:hypothetical protein
MQGHTSVYDQWPELSNKSHAVQRKSTVATSNVRMPDPVVRLRFTFSKLNHVQVRYTDADSNFNIATKIIGLYCMSQNYEYVCVLS